MKKIQGVIAVAACLFALSAILPPPAAGQIKKCVGPEGDVQFTNQECPDGYVLEGSRAASEPSPSSETGEPRICRFSSSLESSEVVSAVTEAEISLNRARDKGDDEAARYWQDCLDRIRRREAELRSRPSSPPGESGPEVCTGGSFDYREGGIYFASDTRGACAGVRAVCTFEVRESQRVTTESGGILGNRREEGYTTTTAQRTLEFDYREKVGKFGTARIGDVTLSGKVIGWNCRHER